MNFYLFLNFSKIKNIRSEIIYKKIEKTIKTSKQRNKETKKQRNKETKKQRIKESKNPKRASLKKWKKN
jgi:hypothetical protein